jgi:HEAT repeat protein
MFVEIRDTRVEAAKFLAQHGDKRGIRALIVLCESKDVSIRREAVQALGTLGDAIRSPHVVDCLLAVCLSRGQKLESCRSLTFLDSSA